MYDDTGGIPVTPGGADGDLVTGAGFLQFGHILLGGTPACGWRNLTGWRDSPDVQLADSPRPQSHGSYPGSVLGDSLVVTYDYLVRGTPDAKIKALAAVETYAPIDSVERALVVNDGEGAWFRRARVMGRQVPQDARFSYSPAECSIQFVCADPRRYQLAAKTVTVRQPTSTGGLVYPLVYPLDYGTSNDGQQFAANAGNTETPPVVQFVGPLTNPTLIATDAWQLGFNLTLASGDVLTVDISNGTALLNGSADRLYTVTTDSTPLERCTIPVGSTALTLIATSGTGSVQVTWNDARL